MKRVIGYLRVSSETQSEARQLELIEAYCLENGYECLPPIIEERVSGSIKERAGLKKLKQLTSSDCDMVVFSETSRLSREDRLTSLTTKIQMLLDENIDVYILHNNKLLKGGKELNVEDLIILIVEAKANADERKKIIERTLTGRKSKAKQGCYVGGYIPYGYTTINNPLRIGESKEHGAKLLIVDESQRKIVELIFDLVGNKGYTLKNVAIYLNDSGLRIHGIKWSYSALQFIVQNPIYIGVYKYANEVTQINSIIDKELFEKVQEQRKINAVQYNRGVKHFNLLKGIIKCPCGGSLTIQKKTSGKAYYHCTKKHSHGYIYHTCTNTGVNANNLDSIVWKVTQAYLNETDFKLKTEQASKSINSEVEQLESTLNNLALQSEKNEIEIESTLSLLLSCTEAEKVYINRKFSLLVDTQTELKNKITEHNKQLSKLVSRRKEFIINLESELMANLTDKEKNSIYKKYIQSVTYFSVSRYKGFIVIDYKNGFKSVISYMNRNTLTAYELPQNCSFNAETRNVIFNYSDFGNTEGNIYNIPANNTKELTYNELEKEFYIDEFLMQF